MEDFNIEELESQWEHCGISLPEYRGYTPVEIMLNDGVYYGHFYGYAGGNGAYYNLKTMVLFEGETVEELEKDFKDSVDDYLRQG